MLLVASLSNDPLQYAFTDLLHSGARQKAWYKFPSIINVLHQAGYATAWIANQEITGKYSMSNLLGRQADILTGNPAFFKGLGGEGVANRPGLV